MKYRILVDREKTKFYPQRKNFIFWKYYDGHPYMFKRYGLNVNDAMKIMDEDINND